MAQGISKVLVGFDGSIDAQLALRWGMDEAERRKAALHVVVCRGGRLRAGPATREWASKVAEERAALANDSLGRRGHPAEVVTVVDGPAAAVLIGRSDPGILVVVGSHGHGRIAGSSLGSVSQHVARQAGGPVVVVRPAANPISARIVVGVDGSGGSEEALSFAFDRASRDRAALFVVYGWRPAQGVRASLGAPISDDVAEEAAEAERLLAESVAGLADKYPDVEVHREAVAVPAGRALADASYNAAMVVVGSRGRGAFEGMLLGSVSQDVLHHAVCPVAVIR
ncbi:universal stress protein [Nocardioides sp.]|uniref:universal stress protein n=1 Tax=Nocardioides sp. TaxID=35761 RepID=UPI00273345BD|nr:universal stress protein [Nocardioides sp.]MDP3894680.1 universal stress protein [Nocardioides sp.]